MHVSEYVNLLTERLVKRLMF